MAISIPQYMPSGEISNMVCDFDPSIHKISREAWVWRPCQITVSREVWETPKFEIYARHLSMEHSGESVYRFP